MKLAGGVAGVVLFSVVFVHLALDNGHVFGWTGTAVTMNTHWLVVWITLSATAFYAGWILVVALPVLFRSSAGKPDAPR